MTVITGAPSGHWVKWEDIDWNLIMSEVKRLQVRIAKAAKEGKFGKVKSLQWILEHSYYAKLLAIKKVTENKGGKTPGTDGIIWKSKKQRFKATETMKRKGYKPSPLRRIYIAKKSGKKRPLGIPTIGDRAMQALYKLGLEPVAEVLSDKNAYGFRPYRSCADAIEQCFNVFSRKSSSRWVLEGDIKSCFDKISHQWLLQNIPMDKAILKKWLVSGFIEKSKFYPTTEGTPQGGVVSPTLLNLTLSGLEAKIKSITKKEDKVNVITYADDFIISCDSKEILNNRIKPAVVDFLKERGLQLSEEKTQITEIKDGFDFLGFNIRKFKEKLIIMPSKDSVRSFLADIREVIKRNKTTKIVNLIRLLNPKICGWGMYFRHACSKKTFSKVDHEIYKSLWNWATRRHPSKSRRWIYKKYFLNPTTNRGKLSAYCSKRTELKEIFSTSTIPIVRHVKIRAGAIPYLDEFNDYFEKRSKRKRTQLKESFPIF